MEAQELTRVCTLAEASLAEREAQSNRTVTDSATDERLDSAHVEIARLRAALQAEQAARVDAQMEAEAERAKAADLADRLAQASATATEVAALRIALDHAGKRIADLTVLARECEWSAPVLAMGRCPRCLRTQDEGHGDGCPMAAAVMGDA